MQISDYNIILSSDTSTVAAKIYTVAYNTFIRFVAVYVDMGATATDSTTLGFTFSGDYSRLYEIKVTQLPCSNEYK